MSKLISGDELSAYERWELPHVGAAGEAASPDSGGANPNLMTAAQIEEVQRQAYQEGFEQGRQDGLAAGQREIHAAVARLDEVMGSLAQPFEALDEVVEQELVSLAIAVARQIIRRELRTDPGEIVAVVREALSALPPASRRVRVRLHPEDAVLVREALSVDRDEAAEGERPWQVIDDPVLSRGGCSVEAENSFVDATLEKRINTVIANLLGGEREYERDDT